MTHTRPRAARWMRFAWALAIGAAVLDSASLELVESRPAPFGGPPPRSPCLGGPAAGERSPAPRRAHSTSSNPRLRWLVSSNVSIAA